MRSTCLIMTIACVTFGGCSDTPKAGVLTVGQPWGEATRTVRQAGYALHDGNNLQMEPAPEAFVELEGDQMLGLNRDSSTDTLNSLRLYEQRSKGKYAKENPPVQEFALPAATRRKHY